MPITTVSGNVYQVVYLDTNALSEIVKRPKSEGAGFLRRFSPSEFVPAFSIYSVVELRRQADVWEKFCLFYSIYPCVVTKPFQAILECEIAVTGRAKTSDLIARAFPQVGGVSRVTLRQFMDSLFVSPDVQGIESSWRKDEASLMETWLSERDVFVPTSDSPNSHDAERYVMEACIDTIGQIHPDFARKCQSTGPLKALWSLPSMLAMQHSKYYRLFDYNRNFSTQDVTDISIAAFTPYADAIVTEAFQADVLKKSSSTMSGLPSEVLTLRGLR